MVKQSGICRQVRTRCPAYRFLVNLHQTFDQSGVACQRTVSFLSNGWSLSITALG
ncbi:Uncharacterised protein [Klebsiella pneumoniae]|nr:Uncharacterised protein [Enterobacter hormaechei]VGG60008.1 Uncharacterised protein [Klebsiella pneumoniae]